MRAIKAIKREDGEKNGGHPPYGYLPNPDSQHWLYDPVAGEVIKQMFAWSASGMSDYGIAQKLNSLGILNPTAYKKSLGLKYYHPKAAENTGLWWGATVRLFHGVLQAVRASGGIRFGKLHAGAVFTAGVPLHRRFAVAQHAAFFQQPIALHD